jgi:hypothetical protein
MAGRWLLEHIRSLEEDRDAVLADLEVVLMLESKVTLAPQLRGTSKRTLWPLGDQP